MLYFSFSIDAYPPTSPTKFLFRGNMPLENGSFAYHQITSTMRGILQGQGFKVPQDFDLIVVRCVCVCAVSLQYYVEPLSGMKKRR